MNEHNIAIWLFCVLFSCELLAQTDPEKVIQLDQVIVSGQLSEQSVKKSVKNVQVITKSQIQKMGATTLADVLNQYINITVQPNINTGKQTVSLFGLGGDYFKVLVDNIPLVNENGFGNNTDLSQVNLEEIERIEIVEGAMGVTHGANAVTGILNIITKKNSQHKCELTYVLQEETVGKEYSLTDQGRHIHTFRAAHNLTKHWYAAIGSNRQLFNGLWGDYGGKRYVYTDGKRGYRTPPSLTWQSNAVLSYKTNTTALLYKFEYMNERFNFIDRTAESTYSPIYGKYTFGDDRRDFYTRMFHHLNANGKWKKYRYNLSLSYQYQEREEETFRYLIEQAKEINNLRRPTASMRVWYSTGSLSRPFANDKIHCLIGYELTHNHGFSLITDEGQTLKHVNKNIDNYDLYSLCEWQLSNRFSLQPGARFSFQTLFANQYNYSLGVRYLFPKNIEARTSVGKSFRTPNFEELYTRSIFMGHAFLGNENLLPERGFSAEISLKKMSLLGNANTILINKFGASYNDIDDKIHNVLLNIDNGTPHTQYINVSRFKNYNLTTSHSLKLSDFDVSLGASFMWISQRIDTEKFKTDDRFLLNINANAGLTYHYKKWDTSLATFYKFNGKSQMWRMSGTGYVIAEVAPYGWLDASLQKRFFSKRLELTIGARNLLNTTDVSVTQENLQGQRTELLFPFGYGRIFYGKLSYNLNINY